MQGYVVAKGNRFYAVIYDGIDPLTGRERRQWHPAGVDRDDADRFARRLGVQANARTRDCGLSLARYLREEWLPAKRLSLRPSTWEGYRNKLELHVIPRLGSVPLRRLRVEHVQALYSAPRPTPHPRHPAAQSWRADQGRQRTPGPRDARLHDGDLPARASRHASRSRAHLRRAPRVLYRLLPGRRPGRRRPKPVRPRRSGASDLVRWWRGWDLNPRPSGYENLDNRPLGVVAYRFFTLRSAPIPSGVVEYRFVPLSSAPLVTSSVTGSATSPSVRVGLRRAQLRSR